MVERRERERECHGSRKRGREERMKEKGRKKKEEKRSEKEEGRRRKPSLISKSDFSISWSF